MSKKHTVNQAIKTTLNVKGNWKNELHQIFVNEFAAVYPNAVPTIKSLSFTTQWNQPQKKGRSYFSFGIEYEGELDYGGISATFKDCITEVPIWQDASVEQIADKVYSSAMESARNKFRKRIRNFPAAYTSEEVNDKEFARHFVKVDCGEKNIRAASKCITEDMRKPLVEKAKSCFYDFLKQKQEKYPANGPHKFLSYSDIQVKLQLTDQLQITLNVFCKNSKGSKSEATIAVKKGMFSKLRGRPKQEQAKIICEEAYTEIPNAVQKLINKIHIATLPENVADPLKEKLAFLRDMGSTQIGHIQPVCKKMRYAYSPDIAVNPDGSIWIVESLAYQSGHKEFPVPQWVVDNSKSFKLQRNRSMPKDIYEFEMFCRETERLYTEYCAKQKLNGIKISFYYDPAKPMEYAFSGDKMEFPKIDGTTLYQIVLKIFEEAKKEEKELEKEAGVILNLLRTFNPAKLQILRLLVKSKCSWMTQICEDPSLDSSVTNTAVRTYLTELTHTMVSYRGKRLPLVETDIKRSRKHGDYTVYYLGFPIEEKVLNSVKPSPFTVSDINDLRPTFRDWKLREFATQALTEKEQWELLETAESLGTTIFARFAKTQEAAKFFASLRDADAQYAQFLLEATPGCKQLSKDLFQKPVGGN